MRPSLGCPLVTPTRAGGMQLRKEGQEGSSVSEKGGLAGAQTCKLSPLPAALSLGDASPALASRPICFAALLSCPWPCVSRREETGQAPWPWNLCGRL